MSDLATQRARLRTTTTTSEDVRILFVDDDASARRSFQRFVQSGPLLINHIDLAACGEEAIDLVRRNPYTVVATDLQMPDINGIELIQQIHELSPMASAMLVTGALHLDLPSDSESSRAITGVIQKPWAPDELENALRRSINLHKTRTKAQKRNNLTQPDHLFNVLYVENNPSDSSTLKTMLSIAENCNYCVVHVERLSEAITQLDKQTFQLVLIDLSLPDARGMDGLIRLQTMVPETPIVVINGLGDEEIAVQALQHGAQDYLLKGELNLHSLRRSIRYAVERKVTEERLVHLAYYDQLTGLANRTTFRARATQILSGARRRSDVHPAILMLDLDRFKNVNDTLGHDAGDQLIIGVAQRIQSAVRDSDVVARLGGDEFVVLIDDIKKEEQLAAPAQRIVEALQAPIYIGTQELTITTSVGIAVYPENGKDVQELLKSADAAMYRAKDNGRNNYQFSDPNMHKRALFRMQMKRDLRGALERGEFIVYYQPLSGCVSGNPVSCEALLRWEHPQFGLIPPNQFVPLLEELRLTVAIGEWVLQSACAQIRQWQQQYNQHLRVSVNISPLQFEDKTLVSKVASALLASELSPNSLQLEVAENLIMRNTGTKPETLHELKALGVRIAVDNFGTGHTRLVSLARFPIDTIKIGRSVIRTIGSAEGKLVTKTAIEIGHCLGLEVVATGVERKSQLVFLRTHHCDSFQGFLITRPLSPSVCGHWLADASQVYEMPPLTTYSRSPVEDVDRFCQQTPYTGSYRSDSSPGVDR